MFFQITLKDHKKGLCSNNNPQKIASQRERQSILESHLCPAFIVEAQFRGPPKIPSSGAAFSGILFNPIF